VALRYEKEPEPREADQPEQYQLFDSPEYTYRVFVTNMDGPLDALVGSYRRRATGENLIKEANNDAGLAAHPSNRWTMNANWVQMVMLAYNLNCWLMLFQREESEETDQMRHTTLTTTASPPRSRWPCDVESTTNVHKLLCTGGPVRATTYKARR
jgi:hypothetical protein